MRNARSIAGIIWLIASTTVYADAFYEEIQYQCDTSRDSLSVRMYGSYNDADLSRHRVPNSWKPWSLVETNPTDGHIVKVKTVTKKCELRDGLYEVQMSANPCNFNPQGMNGASMAVMVSVFKNGKRIAHNGLGSCGGTGDRIITTLVVRPGEKVTLGSTPAYYSEDSWTCFKSIGTKKRIRLNFYYRDPSSGAYVIYENGSEPLQLKLEKQYTGNDSTQQNPVLVQEWQELLKSETGGKYLAKLQGDKITELKYFRRDGKIFKFENDTRSVGRRGCVWEWLY